jgi:hypothetical protein
MTNFGSFVAGTGDGRTLALTSAMSGLLSGMRAAWLEEAMMRISFRQKRNSTPPGGEKKTLGLPDYLTTV